MKTRRIPYHFLILCLCFCISYSSIAKKNNSAAVLIDYSRALLKSNKNIDAYKTLIFADNFINDSSTEQKIIIKHNIGESLRRMGKSQQAISNFTDAFETAQKHHIVESIINTQISLSTSYKQIAEYPEAIKYAFGALDTSIKNNNEKLIAKSYSVLASIYAKQKSYDEAEKHYKKAELLSRKINDYKNLARNLNNLGIIYNNKKKHRKALQYFHQSIQIKQKHKYNTASSYNNIGDAYKKMEMPDSAIFYYKKSMKIKEAHKDKRGLIFGYNNLTKIYLDLDSLEQALNAIKKSEALSKELNRNELLKNLYLNKKIYFQKVNQTDSALYYYENYHLLYTKTLNIKNTEVIADMREKYKSDQLKKESELKDSQLLNKQHSILALIMVIVLIGISLILAIRSYMIKRKAHLLESEAREETQQAHKQIKTVMNEMSHRIKNNLQLLISIMNIQSRQLSDLEARKITQENKNRISAMAIIHRKLYTQHDATHFNMRYYLENLCNNIRASYGMDEHTEIVYQIDEQLDIDVNIAILLGLIANEIVSNSFKYAFDRQTNGLLEVSFKQTDSLYILYIADNGIGIDTADINKKTSFGLHLVQQLCKQLKGVFQFKNPVQGTGFYIEVPKTSSS